MIAYKTFNTHYQRPSTLNFILALYIRRILHVAVERKFKQVALLQSIKLQSSCDKSPNSTFSAKMILLVLPLLFSQLIGLFANWLPTLYLLLWPVLIQTDVTRDNLIIHALVLIIFILTCDVIRQTMHKLVSFISISDKMTSTPT